MQDQSWLRNYHGLTIKFTLTRASQSNVATADWVYGGSCLPLYTVLLQDPKNPSRNRGFAFVEYYNHACAEHARRVMSKSSFRLGSNAPTISWADPRSGPDSNAMSQVQVLKMR